MRSVLARLSKWIALATVGGFLLAGGAGSCLPENFYAGLLGDTIISTVVGAVLNAGLTAAGVQ